MVMRSKRLAAALGLVVAALAAALVSFQDSAQAEGTTLLGSCIIDSQGKLVCADDMLSHRAGKSTYDFEDGNPFDANYVQFDYTDYGLCALTTEGAIVCKHWSSVAWNFPSGKAPAGSNYTSMSAGPHHVCGLNENGGIVCDTQYGDNRHGHLGSPPINRYSQVSVSDDYACAVTQGGQIVCWGSEVEEMGSPPTTGKYSMVSTMNDAACALSESGEILCWGRNASSWMVSNAPTGSNYALVNMRGYPACAITKQGGIDCWSPDGRITLADSGHAYAVGTGVGVCAITTDATVECFGSALPPVGGLGTPGSVLLPRDAEALGSPVVSSRDTTEFRAFVGSRLSGPTGGGVTSSSSANSVTLTATPDDGYRFLRWEGDAGGNQNPLTITLSDHVFVTAIFEPTDPMEVTPDVEDPSARQRVSLFESRILPARSWQIGQPVNLTLPAAAGGSGRYTYSIKYEWNNDQSWTPQGVSFNSLTRSVSGTPRIRLDPNPALHGFTVFLRADDELRRGEWDELAFVVELSEGQATVSDLPPLLPVPDPSTFRPRPAETESVTARISARVHPDTGRVEFALVPENDNRILPQGRSIASRSITQSGVTNRWIATPLLLLNEKSLGRISVQRRDDGRIELSFLPADGSERVLPRSRLYRPDASTESWRLTSTIQIPIPAGCRASAPVGDGIVFPTRRVELEAGSGVIYRATGLRAAGDSVKYVACADNQSISSRTRDQVLFTAGYFYSIDPDDSEDTLISKGLDGADSGLSDYQRAFTKKAWAQIFTTSTKVIYAAIALAHYSPESAADVAALAVKHVAHSIRDTPLKMTLSTMNNLVERPYEVVGRLAHEHVLMATDKRSWVHLTPQRRQSDEILVFENAKLFMSWEYDLARGGVAGAILSWMSANSQVSAWKSALKTAIPSSLDDKLWTLWDSGTAINERGLRSVVGLYEKFPPYRVLNRDLRRADEIVASRHADLLSRLGITEESLAQ
ncbi:MAG: hypothetical protein F4Y35_08775 [Chloroflexi bacterium]|nr:hypothetical protein [Chloroflexota bacterium]